MAYSFEPTHHIHFIGNRQITTGEIRKALQIRTTKAKNYADKFTFTPTPHADRNVNQIAKKYVDKFEFEPMHYISTIKAIRNVVTPTAKARKYIDAFAFEPTHHVNFIAKEI